MSACNDLRHRCFSSTPLAGGCVRPFIRFHSRKLLRAGLLLLGITAAALVFPGLSGSAAHNATKPTAKNGQEDVARQMDPSAWKLSPEAEHLYYYLVLSDGLIENSRITIDTALKGLLKIDPSLPVFQDGATIFLSRGEFNEAENIAQQGLKRFPGDTLLTLLLAGAYSENGQETKAMGLLEDHLKQHPGQREVIEELVRLYLKDGQREKAADMLSSMPEGDQTTEAVLFRAKVLSSLGRSSEALEILRRLVEKEPDSYEGWIEIGLLHHRNKNLEDSVKAFEKAAEISPDTPELWFRIALIQIERKLPDNALKALDNISESPDLLVQAALRLADGQYFKEAETTLDRAAKSGANPDEVSLFLSVIKQESAKDPLAGLEPLESIPPSSPLYPNVLQQKGRIYLQAKQYDKAYAVASDGRKRFPDAKELWGLEAYALVKLGKNAEAEKLLKKALERYSGDEDMLFTLGTVQDEAGKKDEAVKTMEAILAINPKNYQALNYIGYTLAEKNTDLKRALELITSALEQNPDADFIVDSLAWVHYRLGNLEEAWTAINRCISLGGDDPAIWEHYGDIAKAMGKREEAVKGYTEAIARKPANIADVRKKLSDVQKK